MGPNHPIITDIEVLSVEGIRKAFSDGLDPDTMHLRAPQLALLSDVWLLF